MLVDDHYLRLDEPVGAHRQPAARPRAPDGDRPGALDSFYESAIGLQLAPRRLRGHRRGREDLLVLTEEPDARPAGRHAELYHYALLFPSRSSSPVRRSA